MRIVVQKQNSTSAYTLIILGILGSILTGVVIFGIFVYVKRNIHPNSTISRISMEEKAESRGRSKLADISMNSDKLPDQFDANKLFEEAVASATKFNLRVYDTADKMK